MIKRGKNGCLVMPPYLKVGRFFTQTFNVCVIMKKVNLEYYKMRIFLVLFYGLIVLGIYMSN